MLKTGDADFDAVDDALAWVTVLDETTALARASAESRRELGTHGTPFSARDAYIAGAV